MQRKGAERFPIGATKPGRTLRMRILALALATSLAFASPVAVQAQATTATTTSSSAPALTVDAFARQAAQNSLTEVLLSAMALQKSDDKRVDDHAWTMLDHHSRAMGDLADALSAEAAPLPAEPNAEQTATLERMRGLDGAEFDTAYFTHQVEAHGAAIRLFEQAGDLSGDDERIADYARVTLPVLEAHLEIAQYRQNQEPQPVAAQ